MANFSVNQARQLYVVTAKAADATAIKKGAAAGTTFITTTVKGDSFYVSQVGATGEPVRSDLINLGKVSSLSFRTAAKTAPKVNKYTLTISDDVLDSDGNVPAGYSYIARFTYFQFIGMSDAEQIVKHADVYVKKAMAKADFYTALKNAIVKAFKKENSITPIIKVDDDTTSGVVVTECMQPWHLGKMQQEALHFVASGVPVFIDGLRYDWIVVSEPTAVAATDPITGATLSNARDIADLEYFCHGERGDQYRLVGWPNNIDTKYLVNPDLASGYDTLDIQYFYNGDNEDIQHSAKTLTLVAPAGTIKAADVLGAAKVLGLSVYFNDGVETAVA